MSTSKLFAAMCLSSLLLLGACGGGKEESMSKTSSSSNVTKQVKKSESSKKSEVKKTEKSSFEGKKEENTQEESAKPATSKQEQDKPEAATNAATTQTGEMNITAMQNNGDFSSIAGTWTNDQGDSFVFDTEGNVTMNGQYVGTLRLNSADNNGASYTVAPTEGFVASPIGILMNPAGTERFGVQEEQDRMYSGQTAESFNHPFYKVQ